MTKKHKLTNAEIEKDIADTIIKTESSRTDERAYRITLWIAFFISIPLVILTYTKTIIILQFWLAVLLFIFVYAIFYPIFRNHRIKKITIQEYSITTETVYRISDEHYYELSTSGRGGISAILALFGKNTGVPVANYTVHFENGKSWLIPKQNYKWHEQLYRNDEQLFGTIHREDTMIVVTSKKTGKIVMAYHTDLFEYQNETSFGR